MTSTQDWLTAAALHVMSEAGGGRLPGTRRDPGERLAASVHPVTAPEGADVPLMVLRAGGAELSATFGGTRPVREDFMVIVASDTAADARATASRLTARLRLDNILSTVIPAGDDFDDEASFYTRTMIVTLRTRTRLVPDSYPD